MEHRSRSKKFLSVLLMTPCLAFGKSLHCLWIYFQCRADTETRALTRNLLFFIRWLLRKFKYWLTRTAEGAGLSLSLVCELGFGVCVFATWGWQTPLFSCEHVLLLRWGGVSLPVMSPVLQGLCTSSGLSSSALDPQFACIICQTWTEMMAESCASWLPLLKLPWETQSLKKCIQNSFSWAFEQTGRKRQKITMFFWDWIPYGHCQ